ASTDHSLPVVIKLFEYRKPKREANINERPGVISIEDDAEKKVRCITITSEDAEQAKYDVSMRDILEVAEGDVVEVGQQLNYGSVNPHDKLRVEGIQAPQQFLVEEVQNVYRSQGVNIHDKHIEVICRQMLRKVNII